MARVARRPKNLDALLHVWGVLGLLFLFFPIVVIVVYSFNTGRTLAAWEGFGLSAFTSALSNPNILAAVRVSLVVSVAVAVLATVLGTFAGMALSRSRGRWRPGFLALLALVMVTPEIVSAISLLPWFVTLGIDLGIPIFSSGAVRLVIATSLFSTAVVTFIVRARMDGMGTSLEEAAADLYAPPWRRFVDVTLPMIRPAVISGALLSFTFSLDNTVVASFVSVAGATPWPVYVFSAVRQGLRPEVAAMSTVLLGVTLLALLLVVLVLRKDPAASGGGGASRLAATIAG
ncbi:ABC transporter permease [Georgenia yuyongxinii]|uniref:ABC transporter permease n=1 Tax=Georgenia yuyongxinii TaxID=2589797 RepID=A0A5B8C1F0_9MICO|nr:ABC transporter permease [Georgenia yuyongxinii]QDC23311.1 ABC transporter permease [Georgenia yuyongxinii]